MTDAMISRARMRDLACLGHARLPEPGGAGPRQSCASQSSQRTPRGGRAPGISHLVVIAGAGMAGLCPAARARELGASPVVLEKGSRPGGSMLLSSGVVWRYRSFEDFRAQCPGGDPRLQELVHGLLDDGLEWLESLGRRWSRARPAIHSLPASASTRRV